MTKRPHITLADIAKRLGVSRVTVSKALRGHSDISAEMTKKIRKVASDLGYTPNIMARNLSARRSHMIGLVVPKIAHAFFGSVIEGVYDAAFEAEYETILTVSQEDPDRELKHLQTLVAMRVDGIIISISEETRDVKRFKWIRQMGIPLVFVDRRPEPAPPGFSCVLADDHQGAYQATERAIEVGYRKLGFIGGDVKINIGKDRLQGFTDALNEYRIPVNPSWIAAGGHGKDTGYAGLKQFHQSNSLPEFILAATYPVALGIYEAAKELDIRIPDDVDIICFGDSDVGRFLAPPISAVRQPTHELGARAVKVLLENIADTEVTREHIVILPTQLIIRDTCVRKTAQVKAPPPAAQGFPALKENAVKNLISPEE